MKKLIQIRNLLNHQFTVKDQPSKSINSPDQNGYMYCQ